MRKDIFQLFDQTRINVLLVNVAMRRQPSAWEEKKLTDAIGITGLPTVFYIPLKGKPQVRIGLVPEDSIEHTINKILLANKR